MWTVLVNFAHEFVNCACELVDSTHELQLCSTFALQGFHRSYINSLSRKKPRKIPESSFSNSSSVSVCAYIYVFASVITVSHKIVKICSEAFPINQYKEKMWFYVTFTDISYTGKKKEIWLSPMTKTPTSAEMSKGQSDNTINATKSSITQRLWTDLRRSVGVTTATQLVWFTGFTGPTFPLTATAV